MTTSYFVPLPVNYSCTLKLNSNLIKPPDLNTSFQETLGLGGLVEHQQNDTVRSIQTVRSSVGQWLLYSIPEVENRWWGGVGYMITCFFHSRCQWIPGGTNPTYHQWDQMMREEAGLVGTPLPPFPPLVSGGWVGSWPYHSTGRHLSTGKVSLRQKGKQNFCLIIRIL